MVKSVALRQVARKRRSGFNRFGALGIRRAGIVRVTEAKKNARPGPGVIGFTKSMAETRSVGGHEVLHADALVIRERVHADIVGVIHEIGDGVQPSKPRA